MQIYDQVTTKKRSRRFAELFEELGVHEMNRSKGGEFTRNFLSLQLQLQTLMEGVGGDGTASLLDSLAQLSDYERKKIIPLLSRVVSGIAKSDKRIFSDEDRSLKDFEDALYDSIIGSLGHSANNDEVIASGRRSLEVVPGGKQSSPTLAQRKPVKSPSLIDLAKARESRRVRLDTPPSDAS